MELLASPISELQIIPESGWVQAVFVCLFLVLVISVFGWVMKLQKNWQDFITANNREWREWMEAQEERRAKVICEMTVALNSLAKEIQEHDAKVEARINASEKFVTGEIKNGKTRKKAVAVV